MDKVRQVRSILCCVCDAKKRFQVLLEHLVQYAGVRGTASIRALADSAPFMNVRRHHGLAKQTTYPPISFEFSCTYRMRIGESVAGR